MSYSSLSPSQEVDTRTWLPRPDTLRRSCQVTTTSQLFIQGSTRILTVSYAFNYAIKVLPTMLKTRNNETGKNCHYERKTLKKLLASPVQESKELKQRRRLRQRERERQKSNRFRLATQQLCRCIALFSTFLCRHFTTTAWKCLIPRFAERQRLWFFFSQLRYIFLELNSKTICQHWTHWTRWNNSSIFGFTCPLSSSIFCKK